MGLTRLARLCVVVACVVSALAPSRAVGAEDDASLLPRIEKYLNSITTLRANFLQINHDGTISEGQLWIMRPGRMRIDYAPPMEIEIVADGEWLTYIDNELGQISQAPLNGTHAEILVGENISLGDDIEVTDIQRAPDAISITIARRENPGEGTLTLVFADNPLELRQWAVLDPQGLTTRVTLFDTVRGLPLDPDLFAAPPPFPEDALR